MSALTDYEAWRENVLYTVAREKDSLDLDWDFPVAMWYNKNDPIDINYVVDKNGS